MPFTSANFSGNTLTIPHLNLEYNQGYYITIGNGIVADLAGNFFTGITSATTWNFITEMPGDITPPTVSSFLPLDNATGVAIGANLVVTFNENVQPITSGGIQLKFGTGVIETFVLPNAKVVFSGSTVTINPTNNLNYGSTYHIVIHNNSLEDIAGNNLVGFTDATTWNFTTEAAPDVTAPAPVTFVPTDNATGVSISNNLTLSFNENIQLTGGAVLKNSAGTTIPSSSTVSGSVLTINPTTNLNNSTQYYVTIASGVIKDVAGNSFAGFSSSTAWNFTTETGFSIVSISPVNNATGVTVDQPFTITFNEPLLNTGTGSFRMYDANTGTQVGINWAMSSMISITGNSATINYPTGLIAPGQSIYFVLSGGITNMAGVVWSGFAANDYTLHFAVPDVTAPLAQTYVPLNNATGVSIANNLTLTFDETIQLTGSAVLKNSAGSTIPSTSSVSGSVLTINPTANLSNSTQYYVTIASGVIKDVAGNSFAGFTGTSTWSFTTEVITSVTNISNNGVSTVLYPNPTNGNFTIDLGVNYEEVEIIIMDIKGQIVSQSIYSQLEIIELQIEAAKGMYFVRILTKEKHELIKLIKE